MQSLPFWKRKKAWEDKRKLAEIIVSEINEEIEAMKGGDTNE